MYYILKGTKTIKVADIYEYSKKMKGVNTTLKHTKFGEVLVSTVFLGLDHNFGGGIPILFETMIFGGEHDQFQERYATWVEAINGHKRACKMVDKHI